MTHATKAIYRLLLSDYVKVSKVSVEDMLFDEQDIIRSMDRIEVGSLFKLQRSLIVRLELSLFTHAFFRFSLTFPLDLIYIYIYSYILKSIFIRVHPPLGTLP